MGSAAASRQLGQTATAAQRLRTLSNTFTSTSRGSSDKSVASLSAGEGVQHRAQPLSEKRYALDVVMAKAAVKKRARDQMAAPLHFHWSYISVRLAPSAELSSQRLSRLRSQRLRAPSLVFTVRPALCLALLGLYRPRRRPRFLVPACRFIRAAVVLAALRCGSAGYTG